MAFLEIANITKTFGNLRVLKGITFEVNQREIVSIVGPSGAGKTTLLNIIGTLEKPDNGSVTINGVNVTGLKDNQLAKFRNKNIGFVFQFHQLLPEFNIIENVAIPALIGGEKSKSAYQRATELIEYFGLSNRINHKPAQLSGGEKQRVAVARALINRPQIILADEPSGSLDSENRQSLHKLFFDLRKDFDQTFIIVTHDESLATSADKIIHLKDGLII